MVVLAGAESALEEYHAARVAATGRFAFSLSHMLSHADTFSELADATFTVSGKFISASCGDIQSSYAASSDILTVHRARHLYDMYNMLDIPFSDPTMKQHFKGQCLCR